VEELPFERDQRRPSLPIDRTSDDDEFVPITSLAPLDEAPRGKMLLIGIATILLIVGFIVVVAVTSRSKFAVSPNPATATSSSQAAAAAARPAVHVYNVSRVDGADARVADRLRDAYWNATSDGRLEMSDVTVTTVYYDGRVPGQQAAAGDAALLIGAAVQPRTPALAGQPHGLIVLVTG